MKAYLIPGSGENIHSRDYQTILAIYKKHGYDPQFVSVTWRYRNFEDYFEEIRNQISEEELEDALLSGFSWGAMLALKVAARINSPRELFLYSLSPYFAEDMPLPKYYYHFVGKRRLENLRQLSFADLASKISSPTTIFIGSKEIQRYPNMQRRANEAHKIIVKSKLCVVEKAGHDVTHPLYLKAIEDNI